MQTAAFQAADENLIVDRMQHAKRQTEAGLRGAGEEQTAGESETKSVWAGHLIVQMKCESLSGKQRQDCITLAKHKAGEM